ncbi:MULTISPECIES: ScbR family autoregulator-binding transcription factor [Streptomyces]|uniref:ScbR family autoregulator-binding transcription factor n=1 Tax=Streptomyces TaxID=1883 RepID=UPI00073A7E3C|nr:MULTISPECIES: ScbR family autoregulator-binding transcription factor [Streptomyces]ALV34839.1 gamma-butyrolactone-binding protein [Streptomyces sp. CdTB01]MCL6674187.1 TetR/AcrR family transcriptional regulator [Streptomyces panaciradicis]
MAQQERAIRTRAAILQAAAEVFAERGYAATTVADILKVAGVTKGALYFHFDSKKALAKGVLGVQTSLDVPAQNFKLQEMVDTAMVVAHRLTHDPVLRAGAKLSEDRDGRSQYGSAWPAWIELLTRYLVEAQQRNEVLAHVVPRETAEFVLTAFHGAQTYSHLEKNLTDIEYRVSVLFRHMLPSIAAPAVLANLDTAPDRGARVYAQMQSESEELPALRAG